MADPSASVFALLFGSAVLMDLIGRDLTPSNERALVLAVLAAVLMVVSVLVHELAHAFMAFRNGLRVLRIRLMMYGGYSVIEGIPLPMTEFRIAAAGPLTSIGLGFLFWLIHFIEPSGGIGAVARALALGNLAIGVFNLFPGFPLDGGRVLRGLLSARGVDAVVATRTVAQIGRYTGWGVVAVGLILIVLREPFGLFWVIAGWFLAATAWQAGRREEMAAAYAGQTAGSVMRPVAAAVPGSMKISTMVEEFGMGAAMRSEPVEIDGRVVGIIGFEEIDAASPAQWVSTSVARLMTKIGPDDVVAKDEPLQTIVLHRIGQRRRLIVTDGGTVVGIIDSLGT
ncbi:MAG: M50 family metallopeptidase [Acidimicrobiia bacterium]